MSLVARSIWLKPRWVMSMLQRTSNDTIVGERSGDRHAGICAPAQTRFARRMFVSGSTPLFLTTNSTRLTDRRRFETPFAIASRLRRAYPNPEPLMPVLRQVPKSEAKAEIVLRMYGLLFGDRDPVSQPGTAT